MTTEAEKQAEHERNCKMCNKPAGLPVLLTRYAIAQGEPVQKWYGNMTLHHSDSKAPKLSGSFKATDGEGKSIDLEPSTYYTQRMLRGGYLYVFHEKANLWEGYYVTASAYLMPFRIGLNGPEPVPDMEEEPSPKCNPNLKGPLASCVVVPFPEKATNVWFVFSDVEWTKEVWEAYRDNRDGRREKNMRKLNVKAWMGSQKAEHAAPVGELMQHVADFAKELDPESFHFSAAPLVKRTSSFDFTATDRVKPGTPTPTLTGNENTKDRARKLANAAAAGFELKKLTAAENMIKKIKAVNAKAAIVAIDDPVAITMDLDGLMNDRVEAFNMQDAYRRELHLCAAIDSLKQSVYENAAEEELKAMLQIEGQALASPSMLFVGKEKREKYLQQIRNVDTEKVAKKAWAKYAAKYDATKADAFKKKYQEALDEFNKQVITPLARAHASWMKSTALKQCFRWQYDRKDLQVGAVYTTVLSACIGSTQDKGACGMVYEDWLTMDFKDEDNLLGRALALNNDGLLASLDEASAAALDLIAQKEVKESANSSKVLKEADKSAVGIAADKVGDQLEEQMILGALTLKLHDSLTRALIDRKSIPDVPLSRIISEFKEDTANWEKVKAWLMQPAAAASDNNPVSRLIAQVAGKATNFMLGAADKLFGGVVSWGVKGASKKHVMQFMLYMSSLDKTPYNFIEARGTVADFFRSHEYDRISKLNRVSGAQLSATESSMNQTRVEDKLRVFKSRHPNMDFDKVKTKRFPMRLSWGEYLGKDETLAKMPPSICKALKQGGFAPIRIDIRDWVAIQEGRWDDVNWRNIEMDGRLSDVMEKEQARLSRRASTKIGRVVPHTFMGVFGIAMLVSSISTFNAFSEETKDRRLDGDDVSPLANMANGVTAFSGTVASMMERTASTARFRLKFGKAFAKNVMNISKSAAKGFGIAGAVIMVALDAFEAFREYQKGHTGLVVAHAISAFLGIAGMVLICFPGIALLVGIAVLIAGVIMSIVISIIKGDEIEQFLEECLYGKRDADDYVYPDGIAEMNAFRKVFA